MSKDIEVLFADITEYIITHKEYFIGFIVIILVIKFLNQVHHDYKEEKEDELDTAIRKENGETRRKFRERYEKYLSEKNDSKKSSGVRTGYTYGTNLDEYDSFPSNAYDEEPQISKKDDEPDMIDIVEEKMEIFQRTVNDEMNQQQLFNHERDSLASMDEFNRQNDSFSNDMNNHMDNHRMEDQYQNDSNFHDDYTNNDY